MSCASETGCLTLIWKIENFSILFSNGATVPESSIRLPAFKVETTEGIDLCMVEASLGGDDFQLHLWNSENENPFKQCDLSLISSNDEILLKTKELSFKKNLVVGDDKQPKFPQGTLTLCIRVWEEKIINAKHHILTILYQENFYWNIKNFDFSEIPACSKYFETHNLACRMRLEKKSKCMFMIMIEGIPSTRGFPAIYNCKFSFKDKTNKWFYKNDTMKYFSYNTKCFQNIKVSPSFSIIHSLQIEIDCILAVHEQFEEIKEPLNTLNTDLWHMYKEGIYSDATLEVKKKSYRVHRNILAARSSVFHSMFEEDQMTDARSGIVAINDIGNETIELLLAFMYGDTVEDLKWEEASALYYASEKYAIHPLKEKCFCMLKQRLTMSNVCEALILADALSDVKLMSYVVDFICAVEDLEWEEAAALYYTAEKYAIHPLKEKCFGMLKQRITMSNVCEALILADALSDEKLMRFVVDFICAIEDLEWEEASALYYAVDQYAIQPLKEKCFGMLKQRLTVSNVCKALVLAEAHSDEKLMRCIVDFICDHKEVVCSKEWAELQESNSKLTSKIASELFLKTV